MGRVIRRVDPTFDWPLRKVWDGFLTPEDLRPPDCPACGGRGESPEAYRLHQLWYGIGDDPFAPEHNGSTPHLPADAEARAWASRQCERSPWYYGTGEEALHAEAVRITDLWNQRWSCHLNQDDVDALIATGCEPDGSTAQQVNRKYLLDWRDPGQYVVTLARLARTGYEYNCTTCDGTGDLGTPEQRAAYENWEGPEPPSGTGWQVWETTSEGSPVTPVFATREELVGHLCTDGQLVTSDRKAMSRYEAEALVDAGSVPTWTHSEATGMVHAANAPGVFKTLDEIQALPEAAEVQS